MSASTLRLETARLLLRPPQMEDFEAWAALMADPQASPPIGGPQSRPLAWRGFMTVAGAWSLLGFGMFSVIEKSSGRWIGRLGPWQPEGWPGTEVGWALLPQAWGQGYATEGAAAAIDWAFGQLGWTEVIHAIAPANQASQAVARRLGSQPLRTARLPPPVEDIVVDIWGQTREQWRSAADSR